MFNFVNEYWEVKSVVISHLCLFSTFCKIFWDISVIFVSQAETLFTCNEMSEIP
jgi:hypothetical protein